MNHDFTRLFWGHNITVLKRNHDGSHHIAIWSAKNLQDGDTVTTAGRWDGKSTRLQYKLKDVKRQIDPSDMYFATLVYPPEVVE